MSPKKKIGEIVIEMSKRRVLSVLPRSAENSIPDFTDSVRLWYYIFPYPIGIIGTGCYGLMKVPLELIKYLNSNNIEVIIKKTKDTCDEYNTLHQKKNVVATFHLTC